MDALIMCGGHGTRLRGRRNDSSDNETRPPDEVLNIETNDNSADHGDGSRPDNSVTNRSSAVSDQSIIDCEKPLIEINGTAMLSHVANALTASPVETVWAVTSPNAPRTATAVREASRFESIASIETPGDGYVADLQHALSMLDTPVVTTPADLPLISSDHIAKVINTARLNDDNDPTSTMLCVPVALKKQLGVSVDTVFEHDHLQVAPSGINIVAGDTDTVQLSYDARLAINVNRPTDKRVAEKLCE